VAAAGRRKASARVAGEASVADLIGRAWCMGAVPSNHGRRG
jgi:hypothetical protein